MNCRLIALALWSEDESQEPKIIPFETSRINVIIGSQKSGKSAIWHIFEYCVGSSACRIPRDILLEKVFWFGIVLRAPDVSLVCCRKNPELGNDAHVYFKEGTEDISVIKPVWTRSPHCSLPKLRARTEELLGPVRLNLQELRLRNKKLRAQRKRGALPNNSDRFLDNDRKQEELSNHDFRMFCYLPQHIHSDPNVLFETYNEQHRRKKLPIVLPILSKRRTLDQQIAHVDAAYGQNVTGKEKTRLNDRRSIFNDIFQSLYEHAFRLKLATTTEWIKAGDWQPGRYSSELRSIRHQGKLHSTFIREALNLLGKKEWTEALQSEFERLQSALIRDSGLPWVDLKTCYDRVLVAQSLHTAMEFLKKFAEDFKYTESESLELAARTVDEFTVGDYFSGRLKERAEELHLANLSELSGFDVDQCIFVGMGNGPENFLSGVGGSYEIFGYHLALFFSLHYPEDMHHSELLDSFIFIDSPGKAIGSELTDQRRQSCKAILSEFLLQYVGEFPASMQIFICDRDFDTSCYPSDKVNVISFNQQGLVPDHWKVIPRPQASSSVGHKRGRK